MKQVRREFIKNTTIAGLGTTVLGNEVLATPNGKHQKVKTRTTQILAGSNETYESDSLCRRLCR